MHLLLTRQFLFNFSEALQYNHLLDIWHLNRAHRLTLCGVKIGKVFKKQANYVQFELHRFGKTCLVEIHQNKESRLTTVSMKRFKLEFKIRKENDTSHWLEVGLFSTNKWYKLLIPFIDIIFHLTVIEDRLYYSG